MRLSVPLEYQNVSEALLKGTCPFCTYLKNYQSKILRDLKAPEQIKAICNFHAWAMAAASNKAAASCVFRVLLEQPPIKEVHECDFCSQIRAEEETRMKEFADELSQTRILEWVKTQGTFCIPHGTRLLGQLPRTLQLIVMSVLKRTASQLQESLEQVGTDSAEDKAPGGGVLGHAAEFLVSQRGL
jgi:hypothetical protein